MWRLDPLWISAIAGMVAAIAAVVYFIFTWWVNRKMSKDRRLADRPVIEAILIGDFYPGRLRFELKNIGKGPALNLKFDCKDNGEGQWKIQNDILPIGSSEKIEATFLVVKDSYKPGEEIFLDVEYKDILGKPYQDRLLTLSTNEVIENIGVTKK